MDFFILWDGSVSVRFLHHRLGTAVDVLRYTDINYGILPMPKYAENEDYIAANASLGLGYSNAGEPVAVYWAQKTGTVYFYVDYRSVWGPFFGPGINLYFDNLSVKVTFAEEGE